MLLSTIVLCVILAQTVLGFTFTASVQNSTLNSTKHTGRKVQHNYFGVSREEWLAKEYFTYLCAPTECVNDKNKTLLRQACYNKHNTLRDVMERCFGSDGRCNASDDRSLICAMDASRRNPTTIPLELHDCVDGMITLKMWKCIRRVHMERARNYLDDLKKRQEMLGIKKPRREDDRGNMTMLFRFAPRAPPEGLVNTM